MYSHRNPFLSRSLVLRYEEIRPCYRNSRSSLRGNVLDLAIGVIIGAAFGKIVTSLVNDVIMPPIGVLLSVSHAQDFQDKALPLSA